MADTLAESPQSALSGVARVLVHAGKLNEKAAEALVKSARERKISFVAAVMAAFGTAMTKIVALFWRQRQTEERKKGSICLTRMFCVCNG